MELEKTKTILKRIYSKYGEDLKRIKKDIRPDYSRTGKYGHAYFGIDYVDIDTISSSIGNLTAVINDPFGAFDFDIDHYVTEKNLLTDVMNTKEWLHRTLIRLQALKEKYDVKECAHYPLDITTNLYKEVYDLIDQVLSSSEVKEFQNSLDDTDEIKIDIHFEQIQGRIIEKIKEAKFSIWVAVAWLTDKAILKELHNKHKEGLDVKLIVLDDDINAKYGIDYQKHFNAKLVKPFGKFQNIMHNKFCVIDLKVVIHGSYNWTNKARYNKETVSIDVNREIAEKFASQFIDLSNE